jgi:hypothetical protein
LWERVSPSISLYADAGDLKSDVIIEVAQIHPQDSKSTAIEV